MVKRLLLRYSDRIVSRWIIVMIDVLLLVAALLIANILRFDFDLAQMLGYHIPTQIIIVAVTGCISLLLTSSHKGIIRHTGQTDAIRIIKAITLTLIILFVLNYVIFLGDTTFHRSIKILGTSYERIVPNSVILIFYPIALLFLLVFRMVIKLIYYTLFTPQNTERINVLIYGAGREGIVVRNTLSGVPSSLYHVSGFIDDNTAKVGKSLEGTEIFSPAELTNSFLQRKKISEIIIAIPGLSPAEKSEILNKLLDLHVTIKNIPPVEAWINGELKIAQIQNIKIEELLQRDPIRLDNEFVLKDIIEKTVVVTGAAGSIGREISRQLLYFNPKKVIFIDQAESPLFELQHDLINLKKEIKKNAEGEKIAMEFRVADISDNRSVAGILKKVRPQLIFHAAAYKHVPLMEANPMEAVRVNIFGTQHLAEIATETGVEKFVMISTDKAVNPTSIMGATKRIAEIYIQSLNSKQGNNTRFITTRFGNVLGSNGSVTEVFKKQISAGGPVTVTHPEITRYFMTIPEACRLVFEAGAMGKGGEIFIFDMGEPVKIIDLAKNMIRLSGFIPEVEIPIIFIGMRPGEKLFEELLLTKETTLPTHHPKILIAKVKDYPFDTVLPMIEELTTSFHTRDLMAVVRQLKKIIPNYISNNSVFQKLDIPKGVRSEE